MSKDEAEDARFMAQLTALQTTERRKEVIAELSPNVLRRLLHRFVAWEPRFPDGAINSALIREELRGQEHAEQSLAVLEDQKA